MGFTLNMLEKKSLKGFIQSYDITQYRRIILDVVQGQEGGGEQYSQTRGPTEPRVLLSRRDVAVGWTMAVGQGEGQEGVKDSQEDLLTLYVGHERNQE